MPGEAGYYIGVADWIPLGKPWIDKGHAATFTGLTKLQFAGTPKYTPSGEIGIAAGAHNTLKISYFQSKASGTTTAPTDLVLFSHDKHPEHLDNELLGLVLAVPLVLVMRDISGHIGHPATAPSSLDFRRFSPAAGCGISLPKFCVTSWLLAARVRPGSLD